MDGYCADAKDEFAVPGIERRSLNRPTSDTSINQLESLFVDIQTPPVGSLPNPLARPRLPVAPVCGAVSTGER
jgi:hypothetical protein